jgi:hypothetical protein
MTLFLNFYALIVCADDFAYQNRMGSTTVQSNDSIFELLKD